MANRAALRELQSRLASRLQAAREQQQQTVSWLAIESAAARYLFPLTQADEIFSTGAVQPVPYAHAWFVGVANLRGGLFGVVDLARFVDAAAPASRPTGDAVASTRMVTLNASLQVNCAVLIDRLAGLRSAESFEAMHEAAEDAPNYFGRRYVDADRLSWQELDLRTLVQSPRFLEIGV